MNNEIAGNEWREPAMIAEVSVCDRDRQRETELNHEANVTITNDRTSETAAQCVTISDHSALPAVLRSEVSPGFSCSDFAIEAPAKIEETKAVLELTERGF